MKRAAVPGKLCSPTRHLVRSQELPLAQFPLPRGSRGWSRSGSLVIVGTATAAAPAVVEGVDPWLFAQGSLRIQIDRFATDNAKAVVVSTLLA